MSLAPEAIAFIGRPPDALPPATRAHRLGDDFTTENPMPTGVYPRKKKAASPAVEKPEAKAASSTAKARKPRAKAKAARVKAQKRGFAKIKAAVDKATSATSPRFGVFDDGTVELRLEMCSGILLPTEAREFLGFLKRIGVE